MGLTPHHPGRRRQYEGIHAPHYTERGSARYSGTARAGLSAPEPGRALRRTTVRTAIASISINTSQSSMRPNMYTAAESPARAVL